MYATVRLLNGFKRTFTYAVSADLFPQLSRGTIVQVPFQTRIERALICQLHAKVATHDYELRLLHGVEQLPPDPLYIAFIEALSTYYCIEPVALYRRLYQPAPLSRQSIQQPEPEEDNITQSWHLTGEQKTISDQMSSFIGAGRYQPLLLHGVTGSGKTAVYYALIQSALSQEKSVIIVLPEVSLARTLAMTLRAVMSNVRIYESHSACSQADKRALWTSLQQGEASVIVGVHLPILLPVAHLGLIIIDEEHDAGFQEKRHPRINTKDAALLRAQLYKIPILLGSATPSIAIQYLAQQKNWLRYSLYSRFTGAFPTIHRVQLIPDMRKKNGQTERWWISRELQTAIQLRLQQNEQVLLYLNRRGLNRSVQCGACATLFSCDTCSVALTVHLEDRLLCHYCGRDKMMPAYCMTCGGSADTFITKGIGTQKIVEIVQSLFPAARIARADTDSVRNQKEWQKTLQRMKQHEIDILVGTQTITKGYTFPRVTLVGVIWAESNLGIPFYTATEATVQQLLQVAGRAGRCIEHSEVIIQSFKEYPFFNYLNEKEYARFYEYELQQRADPLYPPFVRLSEIELQGADETILEKDSLLIEEALRAQLRLHKWPIQVLGPALPPVYKIKSVFLRRIYFKSGTFAQHRALVKIIQHLLEQKGTKTRCFFTPNPTQS